MMNLVSVGFITVLIGLALYTSYEKTSGWTVGGYDKLTGRKLDYLAAIKFYGITAVVLTAIGIIIGLVGLFVSAVQLAGSPIVATYVRVATANLLISAGFISLVVGLLFVFWDKLGYWTVAAYRRITTGKTPGYHSIARFYFIAGAFLIAVGIIAGLIGLFVGTIQQIRSPIVTTPLRVIAENILVSVGSILLFTGICLYTFNKRVGGSTAVAYFILTGEKLNYIATLKFYALAGASLVGIGIVVGLVGLFK